MVDFINPFRGTDPTAQAIANLGNAMFGNSGQRNKNTAELYALNRQNAETDNYAKRIAALGAAAALADPNAQASLFLSGYKPGDAADLGLAGAANEFGATDPRTVNAQIGAGQSYSATAPAFNATLAENRRQFDQTPVAVVENGAPVYQPRVGAFGLTPVLSNSEVQGVEALQNFDNLGALSDEQQRYLGVMPKSTPQPDNYIFPDGTVHLSSDGITDNHGVLIPQGAYKANVTGSAADSGMKLTSSNLGAAQDVINAGAQYKQLSDALKTEATAHPENFGALGAVRGGLQEAVQTIPALSSLFGGQNVNAVLTNVTKQLSSDPEKQGMLSRLLSTYDGGLPTVATLGVLMQYQLGPLLIGQSGRSMTDKDLAMLDKIFPNPQGMFSSAQSTLATLNLIDQIVQGRVDAAKGQVTTGQADTGLTMPAITTPGAQANTAVVPTDEPQEGQTATNPQTGQKLVLRGGQWVPL